MKDHQHLPEVFNCNEGNNTKKKPVSQEKKKSENISSQPWKSKGEKKK